MVEYSLDLQIPEFVWDHPVLDGLSKAAIDIMTWPNDLCSFNVGTVLPVGELSDSCLAHRKSNLMATSKTSSSAS